MTDLATEACTGTWQKGVDEDDKPIYDTEGYLKQTLNFGGKMYDVVLLWTALDYLPEPFVPAVVSRSACRAQSGRTGSCFLPYPKAA